MQRQLREMLGKERDKVDKLWLVPDDTPLRGELQQAVSQGVPVTVLHSGLSDRERLKAWCDARDGQARIDAALLQV